jgi:hypothetical protein
MFFRLASPAKKLIHCQNLPVSAFLLLAPSCRTHTSRWCTLACRIGFGYLHFAPFLTAGGQPRSAGAIPYTLYINLSRPAPASICNMILLNCRKAHNPVAGAGRPSSLVASLVEFVSLTMLKLQTFNDNVVVLEIAVLPLFG